MYSNSGFWCLMIISLPPFVIWTDSIPKPRRNLPCGVWLGLSESIVICSFSIWTSSIPKNLGIIFSNLICELTYIYIYI